MEQSRTEDTENKYLRRAKLQLLPKYSRERHNDEQSFAEWMLEKRADWAPSTWRQYKASAIHYLEIIGKKEDAGLLREATSEPCKCSAERRSSPRTSAKKKKNITESEEKKIVQFLEERQEQGRHWAPRILAFLKAGRIAGLRPTEWEDAELIALLPPGATQKQLVLKVTNAKATNGRAHGEYRHLVLDTLNKKQQLWIQLQLRYVSPETKEGLRSPEGERLSFHEYYDRARWAWYYWERKIFPRGKKSVTFYSARHQFSADMKAAGYSLAELAACMGHAVDGTAVEHYGKLRNGKVGRSLPSPLATEVAKIQSNRPTPAPQNAQKSAQKKPARS